MELPHFVAAAFCDCDIEQLDLRKHSAFCLGRLMMRAETRIVAWLRQNYTIEELVDYLHMHGAAKMGPHALRYWCGALGVEESLRDRWCAAAQARVRLAPFRSGF